MQIIKLIPNAKAWHLKEAINGTKNNFILFIKKTRSPYDIRKPNIDFNGWISLKNPPKGANFVYIQDNFNPVWGKRDEEAFKKTNQSHNMPFFWDSTEKKWSHDFASIQVLEISPYILEI